MQLTFQQKVISALTAVFLSLTYIVLGYVVCAGIPYCTTNMASFTVDASGTPFQRYQLIQGAEATREYSFGSHDLNAYLDSISKLNKDAKTPYADASHEQLLKAPLQYSVDQQTISHLDDVQRVSSSLTMPIIGLAVIAAFLLMAGLRMYGTHAVARSLFLAGIISLCIIGIFGLWMLVSFNSLFTLLHSLFFADGSWLFPNDSLLIKMLPQNFWIGMGVIWLSVTVLLSALSIFLGRRLSKKENFKYSGKQAQPKKQQKPEPQSFTPIR